MNEEHDREQHLVSAVPFLCWWLPWRPHSRPGLKIHPRRNRPRRKAADQPRRHPRRPSRSPRKRPASSSRWTPTAIRTTSPRSTSTAARESRRKTTRLCSFGGRWDQARFPPDSAEYFKQLGIDPPPEHGDYFVTMGQFAQRLIDADKVSGQNSDTSIVDAFLDAHSTPAKRPWSKKEFPQVAAWLNANEKPLSLLIEASKRPRRFDPLVFTAGKLPHLLSAVEIMTITPYREAARALAARAMLRLNDGRIDDAWQDLLACHRLARLVAEGPTLVDYLGGLHAQLTADDAEQGMLQQTQLSASQAEKMREDLDRLPAMPSDRGHDRRR